MFIRGFLTCTWSDTFFNLYESSDLTMLYVYFYVRQSQTDSPLLKKFYWRSYEDQVDHISILQSPVARKINRGKVVRLICVCEREWKTRTDCYVSMVFYYNKIYVKYEIVLEFLHFIFQVFTISVYLIFYFPIGQNHINQFSDTYIIVY